MYDGFLDALHNITAWIVTGTTAVVATWAGWLTRSVMAHGTKIAVLEESVRRLPEDAAEIKQTLKEMREDARAGRQKLYDRIDDVRVELKEDIRDAEKGRR